MVYVVSHSRMLLHRNEWDGVHAECPQRLQTTMEALSELRPLTSWVEGGKAQRSDLLRVHSADYLDWLERTETLSSEDREQLAQHFDSIYLNQHTYESALLSAGCALEATKLALDSGQHSFALVRPPGHHAAKEAPCGFCFLNNVAICAKYARSRGQRVLIVDWDVHAGQGTQYAVADDAGIRLVSVHRYERGDYWPHLEESAVHHKYPNTTNIPLDRTGYGNSEYISIVQRVVLPIFGEFNPDIVLVSCGFDAALGDPKGGMRVTARGFGYMCGLMAAQGVPVACVLEGGYFLQALAKSATCTLRALIEGGLTEPEFSTSVVNVPPFPTRNVHSTRSTNVDDHFNRMFEVEENETPLLSELCVSIEENLVKLSNDTVMAELHIQSLIDVVLPLTLMFNIKMSNGRLPFRLIDWVRLFGDVPSGADIINEELANDLARLPTEWGLFEQ